MKPDTNTTATDGKAMPWLVMYSNNGDIGILDSLEAKKADEPATGIHDFFVPLDVLNLDIDGKPTQHRRLIAGNYIFLQATREDILRLRQEPPFDATLRFLHPASDPTGCIYIPDSDVRMLQLAVERMDGNVEYFVPGSKELVVGDGVRIIDGPFAGIEGVLESVKGHEGGSVIVPIGDVLAVRTPRIPASAIQLISLATITDTTSGSYTSRAYKKVHVLLEESEHIVEEKEQEGQLSEETEKEARRLVRRFSELQLSGKIKYIHARAIYNILSALGETESDLFVRFRNMLP